MLRICDAIDSFSRFMSNSASLLFLPITLIASFEVLMRYFFNSPTTWAWDVNVQLFALIVVFGAPNLFLIGGHVRMDIFVERFFSERTKQIVSLCLLVFLIVVTAILAWQTGIFAWRAFTIKERTSTLLGAPIYPLKIAIFCGVTLLWLQVISVFLRRLGSLFSAEDKTR
jgi:TRAP-type mannitol/chloroaromatic compound transport system permease small subunit